MKPMRLAVFSVCVVVLAEVIVPARTAADAVAIVSELHGSATLQEPGQRRRMLQVYDWVSEGAAIAVGKGSQVVLVMVSGARFSLKERVRVSVSRAGLSASPGVETLPPIPPLPILAPIASASGPTIAAATRVRGASIRDLYPSGHVTLADSTTLRFDGPSGVTGYLVTINDESGAAVLQHETEQGPVAVPPDVLEPGRSYTWHITANGLSGTPLSARARFTTLSASVARARDELRAVLSARDLEALMLFASVDERLGLLYEAREAAMAAAVQAPANAAVRRLLDRLEDRLARGGVSP